MPLLFSTIAETFPRVFGQGEDDFISQRFLEKRKPVVVLDWGCGTGLAASEIAKKYEGKARVYGFSKDSYKEWGGIQNVKLIHATAEDLLRYLKDNSVDLIYSYIGMAHYPIAAFDPEALPNYLEKLGRKVSSGGKIVLTIGDPYALKGIREMLEKKFDVKEVSKPGYAFRIYLTKRR